MPPVLMGIFASHGNEMRDDSKLIFLITLNASWPNYIRKICPTSVSPAMRCRLQLRRLSHHLGAAAAQARAHPHTLTRNTCAHTIEQAHTYTAHQQFALILGIRLDKRGLNLS